MFIHRYYRLWLKLVRRLASEGQFSAYGEVLYRILDMDFREPPPSTTFAEWALSRSADLRRVGSWQCVVEGYPARDEG